MTNENQDAKFSATNNLRDAMNTKREDLALQSENPECFYESADAATRAQLSDATAKFDHSRGIVKPPVTVPNYIYEAGLITAKREGFERGVRALQDSVRDNSMPNVGEWVGTLADKLLAAQSLRVGGTDED